MGRIRLLSLVAALAVISMSLAMRPPGLQAAAQVAYKSGWNIVAGPAGATFTQANGMLYTSQGSGGYDVLINSQGVTEGYGYRAYFPSDTTVTITGAGSLSYSTTLGPGQTKMVGNPSGTKSATVTGDKIWTYDSEGGYSMFFGSTTLAVGQGAWVHSASGGMVTVAVVSPTATPTATSVDGARALFDVESVDLGQVPLGELVTYAFHVENVGHAPLTIGPVSIRALEGC